MSTDEGVQLAEGPLGGAPGRRRATRRGRKPRADAVDTFDADSVAPVVADGEPTAVEATDDDPRFWHRAHPVFTPLAGFFTGLVTIVTVLALLFWLLEDVVGYDVTEHPWVFLVAVGAVFVINLGLVALPSTRRFARYMLFGVLVTPVVIAVVAVLTSYLLIGS